MLTFLFGVSVIAATVLLIAVAWDEVLGRARTRRSNQVLIATESLVSISLVRAGAPRGLVTGSVSQLSEKKAA